MTLIVGILCSDGVVLAADGAATYGVMGQQTVQQPMKKLQLRGGNLIVGVSGPGSLAQRFTGEIERLWAAEQLNLSGLAPDQIGVRIRNIIVPHIMQEMQMAQVAMGVVGQAARTNALTGTLVALTLTTGHELFQFDQQGSPEVAKPDTPFVSVGSGQLTADPFLAFIRDLFWPNRQPTLPEGLFAAHWTVRHGIKTAPGGIADPIQIAVLQNGEARELTQAELAEQETAIGKTEAALREAVQKLMAPPDNAEEPSAEPPA